MQLSRITIDGFGVLAGVRLNHLTSGVNVFYGSNGSGKTTVLQFVGGVLSGFEAAQQQRLLPPLKGGRPGGSLEAHIGQSACEIIRYYRPGHPDTLAVRTEADHPELAVAVRKLLQRVDADLVRTVLMASGPEVHSLERLVQRARRDGIEMRTQQDEATWITERIQAVESERDGLLGATPSTSGIADLERMLEELGQQIAATKSQQQQRDSQWSAELQKVEDQLAQATAAANRLHEQLQVAQSELTELQDRCWNRPELSIAPQADSAPIETIATELSEEVNEIDVRIRNAQQVLRDLATSRMKLSLACVDGVGADAPDLQTLLDRQRQSVTAMEQQSHRLGKLMAQLADLRSDLCQCDVLRTDVRQAVQTLQQQVSLLCQEFSRQQVAHDRWTLLAQREGVDRCELELTREIQRLRARRDQLIHDRSPALATRLHNRTSDERQHCECDDHSTFVNTLGASSVDRERFESRTVCNTNERHEEAQRQQKLAAQSVELFQQWQSSQNRVCQLRSRLAELQQQAIKFADDDSLTTLRQQAASIEQRLADAREQWQSLTMLRAVLQKTQQKLTTESVPPVIQNASQLLRQMTNGRYIGFRFDETRDDLMIVSEHDSELPDHALSRGTFEQAALSLRLALWQEYRHRGIEMPLILDEVLSDSDEARLAAVVRTVIDFCGDNGQIVFLTCQEPLLQAFEAAGVSIRSLPGSERIIRKRTTSELDVAPTPVELQDQQAGMLDRIQPDEPYWLQTDSAVGLVPSLAEQMARRIGSIGVRTVGNLIELDPENTEIPLDSLQISASKLRMWQAEARLLCCVPDLTARDAQVIVLCGIMSPAELAEADADDLLRRLRRLREGDREYATNGWLSKHDVWPTRAHFVKWIGCGRRARSYRQAFDWANRRFDSAHDADRLHRPHFSHSSRGNRDSVPSSARQPKQTVKLHTVPESEVAQDEELKFYLNMDSPVVDAPGIGPRTAERLSKVGVNVVADLVHRDAAELSRKLKNRRLTEQVIHDWQLQAVLVCRIPELRGHDAQVLVACGFTDVEELAASQPESVFRVIRPFVNSSKGQRLLRSAKTPDLQEVTGWIEFARQSRKLKAA